MMKRYLVMIVCAALTVFWIPAGNGIVHSGVLFAQDNDEPRPDNGSSVDNGQTPPDDEPALNDPDDDDVDSESDTIDESELDNIDPWYLEQEPSKKTDK